MEGGLAAFGGEPLAFGIEEFDLGGEAGLELLAGVFAGAGEGCSLAFGGGELGLSAGKVDAGGIDFGEDVENGLAIVGGGDLGLDLA